MKKNKLITFVVAASITTALISLVVALPHIFTETQISYGIMTLLTGTMFYFLYQIVESAFEVSDEVEVVEEVIEVPTMKAEPKPKRKRRTKAEMQQAAEAVAPKKRGPKSKK